MARTKIPVKEKLVDLTMRHRQKTPGAEALESILEIGLEVDKRRDKWPQS